MYSLDYFEVFEKLKNIYKYELSILELTEIKKQIEITN